MRLTRLSLTNFRNFARLDVDLPGGIILLVGPNAQGKTSLLEAIYLLATFTSFQASSESQMINFLAEETPLTVARVVGEFRYTAQDTAARTPSRDRRLEVRIIREGNPGQQRVRKEILLDGVPCKAGEAIGTFNAVLFLPQMLSMVEGPPAERRRYLNLSLGQVWPHYATHLSLYQKALTQRNALLRMLQERGGDMDQLDYWDEQVASSGAYLIHARSRAIQELERLARPLYLQLSGGQEVLRLEYRCAYEPSPAGSAQLELPFPKDVDWTKITLEAIGQGLLQQLNRQRKEDLRRGMTTIGPHRDDLRFYSNGVDLHEYGSRGQNRSLVMALKLAEIAWMQEKSDQQPLLLLDEVLAELDPQRRQDLLAHLEVCEQVLTTTTDLSLFPAEFTQKAALWRVEGGTIHPQ